LLCDRHNATPSLSSIALDGIVAEYGKVVEHTQAFTLPAPINSERAEASYADGVLTLTLPKAEQAKTRTVKVTAKK
jgi:HSP20 family molecular chaperone IbpA